MNTRRTTFIAGASLVALVAAGCGGDDATTDEATVETPSPTTETTTDDMQTPVPAPGVAGAFQVPGEPGDDDSAFTYDEVAVPVGSVVTVDSE